jgi:iron complex transport system ATP-binding protein
MHDLDLAMRFFERVVIVDGGHVAADGPAGVLIHDRRLDEAFGVAFERLPHPNGVLLHAVPPSPS